MEKNTNGRGKEVRTAVFHPHFRPGGGSEFKAVLICQAARGFGPVTLIGNAAVDLELVDRLYGTSLASGGIEVKALPPALRSMYRFDALSAYRVGRWARERSGGYDLLISAYNPLDFGRPGIQFLADVSFDDELRRMYLPKGGGLRGAFYRRSPMRSAYLGLGRLLSRQSAEGWRANLTVANSRWTKEACGERFSSRTVVIYPPVPDRPAGPPWADRADGFVLMSRIVPEKRIELAIEALRAVRLAGCDVHLHILGRGDDRKYMDHIGRLCRETGGWARYEGFCGETEKASFLGGHKYGISACGGEAFGISSAEMIKAGLITWVPASGGQTEVVDRPELVFASAEEAAARILPVLRDGGLAADIRGHLARRAACFSTGRFVSEVRDLITGFLEEGAEKRT